MKLSSTALCAAAVLCGRPTVCAAADSAEAEQPRSILVTAQREAAPIENPPSSTASIDAARIEQTVNAINVEDTVKYLPSLVVRKRHIGDTQSPLATRTSGVGASARSLIYVDGALLSSLIGNNNTSASPRWSMVSPEEIARIDVLYGPFSAAYPGNSIGAVVNITTQLPDELTASAAAGTAVQRFDQYVTRETLPNIQVGGTVGDRFGPLALFASASHIGSNSQPLAYVTATRPAARSDDGIPASGGFDDQNRTGAPIRVIGASGFEHQRQDNLKLKAALDLSPQVRLAYVGGLFLNDTDSTAQTYLSAAGEPAYAGTFNIGGYAYTVPSSAFSNNVYRYDERHWSHSLSLTGEGPLQWQLIGTLYDFDKDVQRVPSLALPAAQAGGAGNITRLDGTGWQTLDAKASWRASSQHLLSFGAHWDRFEFDSQRYATSDWIHGSDGALNLASRGKTRTIALWAQDGWKLAPPLTLTLGGRYEWWTAFDGFNFSLAPALAVSQPALAVDRFSPKASLAWRADDAWTAALSFGEAYRFPTVSELYQAVTTGPTITVPNPNLKPERALSEELAIERRDDNGTIRLSLFNESIRDALISQSAPLLPNSTTLFNYVQNVGRVRTRGLELAVDRRELLRGFDLAGSVTLVDPEIRADAAFPAAIGKRPPQVPLRRATLVATWRPEAKVSLTAAARYSSRSYGTIDNSDFVTHTYQGFEGYLVVDLRASIQAGDHWTLALGVDNVNDDKYFVFHPFPQRTFFAEARWRL